MNLSDRQLEMLTALCDTFIPSVEKDNGREEFWRRKASDLGVPGRIVDLIGSLGPTEQKEFIRLLNFLDNPLVGLTWSGPLRRFTKLSAEQRETMLQRWSVSAIGLLRKGFGSIKKLTTFFYYGDSDQRGNPNWEAIGYPGPLNEPPTERGPIKPLIVEAETTLDCDTVVVGSGAGGGVVAGELSGSGLDVIVVEKGPYVAEDGFTQREAEMGFPNYTSSRAR